jgi:integrase
VSLFKRGNVWWAYYYIDGVRHQESTGTSNRRIAERIEQRLKDDAALSHHGLATSDPRMTFEMLAAYFMANASPRPHHLDRLKHLLPFFGPVELRRISKGMVREYRDARHRAKRMCDATINRDVAVLRHLLYWAVDEGYLGANPLTRVRLAPERRTPRPVLTRSEEMKLLEKSPLHLRELIILALDTGLRRGELTHQRWEQVDLDRGVLQVSRSKTLQGEGREVPLTRRVKEVLEHRVTSSGYVFTYRGQPIGSIKTAWRTALRSAQLRHVRFHDLRHTFNTRLLEAGVLREVRKALMGHVSGEGVHGVYTHVELPLKRDAIRKLEAWLEVATPADSSHATTS